MAISTLSPLCRQSYHNKITMNSISMIRWKKKKKTLSYRFPEQEHGTPSPNDLSVQWQNCMRDLWGRKSLKRRIKLRNNISRRPRERWEGEGRRTLSREVPTTSTSAGKFALLFWEFILSFCKFLRRHGPPKLTVSNVVGRQEAPGK